MAGNAADTTPRIPTVPESDLTRTYLLVLIVEAVVIACLFWLSRAFA